MHLLGTLVSLSNGPMKDGADQSPPSRSIAYRCPDSGAEVTA